MSTSTPQVSIDQLLLQAQDMDQNQRNLGMKALDTLAKSNLSSFLTELGKILSNESKDSKIRILSAILIKNSLLYTEDFRQAWKSQMTKEDKDKIKLLVLSTLASSKKEIRTIENYNIQVGDGVTIHLYSDAHAGTVIARTKTTLTIQRDKATLKEDWKPEIISGGFVGHCVNQDDQEYDYERDEKGRIYKAHWSNNKGRFIVDGCLGVSKGRNEYYDYNF